jgi:hypothetical protein
LRRVASDSPPGLAHLRKAKALAEKSEKAAKAFNALRAELVKHAGEAYDEAQDAWFEEGQPDSGPTVAAMVAIEEFYDVVHRKPPDVEGATWDWVAGFETLERKLSRHFRSSL